MLVVDIIITVITTYNWLVKTKAWNHFVLFSACFFHHSVSSAQQHLQSTLFCSVCLHSALFSSDLFVVSDFVELFSVIIQMKEVIRCWESCDIPSITSQSPTSTAANDCAFLLTRSRDQHSHSDIPITQRYIL